MQFNKVEITTVRTSELVKYSEEETRELLLKTKNGDKKAREKLIMGNLRLVLSVVQRFRSRDENPDDLFQVGCIGLIKACDNFDITQDVRFSTYAVPMILGELRRFLRDNTPVRVSRSIRDTAYHAMQAKEELINQNNREPTMAEIAERLGLPEKQIVLALEAIVEPFSIYEPIFSDNGDQSSLADKLCGGSYEDDWIDEISIKDAFKSLLPRERLILQKRFFDGKTQTEVAAEIGISQAQVSRLEKSALERIKE